MSNVIKVNAYQINGTVQTSPIALGFPATGCLLRDCSGSATRLLSTGVSVYSSIQYNNTQYYCVESLTALTALFNA